MIPHNQLPARKPPSKRPKLTAEAVVEYIDWALANIDLLSAQQLALHLQAAELVIRTLATAAQNKATQHTLVESGVIAPPPAPLGGGQATV